MNSEKSLGAAILAAGFDAYAIMPAAVLEKMRPILTAAKAEGRYPAFVDSDIEKRIDPRALQPSVKSIITTAVNYYTVEPGPTPPLHGTVSRFAWGKDYHLVLNEGLDRVISYLQKHFGARECTKAVDTSFLIDRALAIEAGLGYPGGNCSVYVPPFGSWVFLGEILVDIELPYTKRGSPDNWSRPVECDAGIRACPTNALIAPGVIRPSRCLSYLTQKSGSIPLEFREKLGNRLWGCDTCQLACPQNQNTPQSKHREFFPKIGPHIPLIPLLSMDNQAFRAAFGQAAPAWRGKNVLQRNACIVLGNQGHQEAIPILEQTSQKHPGPAVREAARWALQKINTRN